MQNYGAPKSKAILKKRYIPIIKSREKSPLEKGIHTYSTPSPGIVNAFFGFPEIIFYFCSC